MTQFDPAFLPGSTLKYALMASVSTIALLTAGIPMRLDYDIESYGRGDFWGIDHGIVVQDTRTADDGNLETRTFFGASGDADYLNDADRRFFAVDVQGDA